MNWFGKIFCNHGWHAAKPLQIVISYNLNIYNVRIRKKEQLKKRNGFTAKHYVMQTVF